MQIIPWHEMIKMVPEWCFNGNLVYYIPSDFVNPLAPPAIILEYFLFDIHTQEEFEDEDWLYVRALVNGKIVDDVHSNFYPIQLNN